MEQSGGGMNRYPDSGSRDFNRPGNGSQFPGGSRNERRQDFESLPAPPLSKYCNYLMLYRYCIRYSNIASNLISHNFSNYQ